MRPDWRFGQILVNVGIPADPFYEEPLTTLQRLEDWIEKNKGD